MKALTDKIIDNLNSLAGQNPQAQSGFCEGLKFAAGIISEMEKNAEFEEVARVMMKHLGQGIKYHPHHSVIITNTTSELSEMKRNVGYVEDYIPY